MGRNEKVEMIESAVSKGELSSNVIVAEYLE